MSPIRINEILNRFGGTKGKYVRFNFSFLQNKVDLLTT